MSKMDRFPPGSDENSGFRSLRHVEEQMHVVAPSPHHTRSNNSDSHHYTNPHHYENNIHDLHDSSFHHYNDIPSDNGYLKTVSARVDGDFDYYFNESPAAQKDRKKSARRQMNNLPVKNDGAGGSINYCTVCLWFIAIGFGLYFIPKFLWR
ncbi:unnamed protein product [Acanthoscelides obtectus]|uniref:Uncharacterized protein n=1 Tax=Acanthoscelides obtectus TaxID=200917 RepID=A0A9P0L9X4_ACAOB|nr:unnamed protein product [Acanthoscelides obtectus]CAK1636303.1 hypothetical protein AOBTE_LOCUS9805 [Acanthoscelides obtectus]